MLKDSFLHCHHQSVRRRLRNGAEANEILVAWNVVIELIGIKTANAAAGSLDPALGTGGVAITNLAVGLVNSIRLQSTVEILVLAPGTTSNEILRYDTEGELDTTFGSSEAAITIGGSMSVAANDQIVVAGIVTDPNNSHRALKVERLNANGSIDTTFGNNGLALADLGTRSPFNDVVLAEPDGSVLACASLFLASSRPLRAANIAPLRSDDGRT